MEFNQFSLGFDLIIPAIISLYPLVHSVTDLRGAMMIRPGLIDDEDIEF